MTAAQGLPTGLRDIRIDALRGLAALGVLLLHAQHAWYLGVGADVARGPQLRLTEHWLGVLSIPITFGNLGVNLFFVLSGLCIHAWLLGQSARGTAFDYASYLQRRFWRLYPAYLAVVLLSLACLAAAEELRRQVLGAATPSFRAQNVLEQTLRYLTFTHTLTERTFVGYNPPLYTMAIEVHFYLLYPLVLLGFRRFGPARTLATSVVLSLLVTWGIHLANDPAVSRVGYDSFLVRWPEWIVGCLIAEHWLRPSRAGLRDGQVRLLVLLSAILLGAAAYLQIGRGVVLNLLWTGGIALLVPLYLFPHRSGHMPVERRLALVGLFSYSLYLIHWPLLRFAAILLPPTPGSLLLHLFVYSVLVAFIMFAAWLFFRAFEAPFLRRREPASG